MQRILIFGGSFNPPTLAHEAMIRACLALPQFDQVWLLPSGERADKHIPTSDEQRFEMLRAVHHASFGDDPRLVVSDFELRLPRPTATYQTIQALTAAYPEVEFWFAFGGDAYRDMPNWEQADTFINTIHTVLFTEEPVELHQPDRLLQLHLPVMVQDMSSTQVRAAVAAGEDASAWVSPAVLAYVAEHQLYR